MFLWSRQYREKVKAEADEYLESFGDQAYAEARKVMRVARKRGHKRLEKFLSRVCVEIAKRLNIEIGLDTATRYLEKQEPYDAGPGKVYKPHRTTLH